MNALKRELHARAQPQSSSYGKWLSNDAVHALASSAETAEGRDAVTSFLEAQGFGNIRWRTPNGDALSLILTFAEAERLLNATYFEHFPKADIDGDSEASQPSLTLARCDHYSLPSIIARHVAFVGPATHFPLLKRGPKPMNELRSRFEHSDAAATYSNDPATLRALYGVGGAIGGHESRQAVTAFLGQLYRPVNFFCVSLAT